MIVLNSDVILEDLVLLGSILFFVAPPVIFFIRAIINIVRAKKMKESKDDKNLSVNYYLKSIIDVLLFIIIIIRLRNNYTYSYFKCFYEHVKI